MQRRRRPTKSTRRSSSATLDDYSIYVRVDRLNRTDLPFRIADYHEEGIFTDDQLHFLVERHGLNTDLVSELSVLVGNALDINSYVGFVRVSRSRVQRRLADALKGKRVRSIPMLDDVGMINQVFAALTLPHFVPVAGDPPRKIRMAGPPDEIFGTGGRSLAIEGPPVPISLEIARSVLVPDDRRTETDERRRAVVEQCCYIAQDAGWSISFTTDSTLPRNQRTGRLIELIKDVIRLSTYPSIAPSGDTIVSDIELARDRMTDDAPSLIEG